MGCGAEVVCQGLWGGVATSETRHEYVLVGSSQTWPRPASRPAGAGLTSSLFVKVSVEYTRLFAGLVRIQNAPLIVNPVSFGAYAETFCPLWWS